MTIGKLRTTTDNPPPQQRLEPLRFATNRESACEAALDSIVSVCGDCGREWRGHQIPEHQCRDFLGRDLAPMKKARAASARRELAALRNFPLPDCLICGRSGSLMKPGEVHTCRLVPNRPGPNTIEALTERVWSRLLARRSRRPRA